MRLEADKLRTILLEVETILPNSIESGRKFVEDISKKHHLNEDELIEYIRLLGEAGLIRTDVQEHSASVSIKYIEGLTFEGHEFINKIRDNRVWDKVKNFLTSTGTGVSIEVIKSVATKALDSII